MSEPLVWFEEAGSISQQAWDRLAILSKEQLAQYKIAIDFCEQVQRDMKHWRKAKREQNRMRQAMRKLYRKQKRA